MSTSSDVPHVPFWRGIANLLMALARWLPAPGLWIGAALIALIAYASISYAGELAPLTLIVDGVPTQMRTHCPTIGEFLQDVGIELAEWDSVQPEPGTDIRPNMIVNVEHARAVNFTVRDPANSQTATGSPRNWTIYTHAQTLEALLLEADLSLGPQDKLWVDGQPVIHTSDESSTPVRTASSRGRAIPSAASISRIEIERALRIQVHDGPIAQTLYTTAGTVGRALQEAGMLLYLGDRVYPPLDALLAAGRHVYIKRGQLLLIDVDGRTLRTRTHADTVHEALAEAGVSLVGADFVVPTPETPMQDGLRMRVVRVIEKTIVEQNEIPFLTEWAPDHTLELDQKRVDNAGANGVTRRRYKAIYHDGQEVERYLEDEWTAVEPQTRQIAYGTKIVIRTLETEEGGAIEYWRRLRVFLTSYTEATCGKTPDDPWYGKTRIGWQMRRGIIAVDPLVIPMLTEMYVPGYGPGIAADTGGMIKGMHIDLGHEVNNFTMYYWWGYVYLRTPVPPASKIRWILPDFPRER
ncbi:MAG: DUF348 domain-containing protein [Anaerolineae bacterium]|nr:DUF348 domain-containing protein [Anaerolineae bacterium]